MDAAAAAVAVVVDTEKVGKNEAQEVMRCSSSISCH